MKEIFFFSSHDGERIRTIYWAAEEPSCIIQIAHGMAEHAERYEEVAEFFVSRGYSVYANDHRGHGPVAAEEGNLGHFADEGGWEKCVGDMHVLTMEIKKRHPDVPVFLLGHSMGSLFARSYLKKYSYDLQGVILSGTTGMAGMRERGGLVLAKLLATLRGRRSTGRFLEKMTFASYRKETDRTPFDWLSRDAAAVDEYIADPLCGFPCSHEFYADLAGGTLECSSRAGIISLNKGLSVLLVAGAEDPVGNRGKGVADTAKFYIRLGLTDVRTILYSGARHELFHEENKREVFEDVARWISEKNS
jgi:alpha-beta hydrolase superfamily lysophospholipase